MDQVSPPVTETPRRGPNLPSWTLTVVKSFDVTPKMRRIVFSVENIDRFEYKPGQDIVFFLNDPAGGHGRRHYTVRAVDGMPAPSLWTSFCTAIPSVPTLPEA